MHKFSDLGVEVKPDLDEGTILDVFDKGKNIGSYQDTGDGMTFTYCNDGSCTENLNHEEAVSLMRKIANSL